MGTIRVKTSKHSHRTEKFLLKIEKGFTEEQIKIIAEKSLEKFVKNTPSKTGLTAQSWTYEIYSKSGKWFINFNNENIQNGVNVVLLIENGHVTPSGKWTPANHFIDKTVKEINDDIINNRWKELVEL